MFVPLHNYSGYTFLKSSLKVENIVGFAKSNNIFSIGLTDKYVMHGFPEFALQCKKNNIKPIFGMDVKISNIDFTFFIKNENGYRNLIKISALISTKEDKNLSFSDIKSFLNGLIIVLHSQNNVVLDEGNLERNLLKKRFDFLKSFFKEFYIGLEIYTEKDQVLAQFIREYAATNNIKIIAFPHARYLKQEDASTCKILDAIENDLRLDFNDLSNIQNNYFYLKTEADLKYYTAAEIDNSSSIFKDVDFEFEQKRGELLVYSQDETQNSEQLLKEKILEGVKFRNIDLDTQTNYKNRLNYEFLTIKKMGFIDYFLIVQDYVLFAKNNNIAVGPGRGSAAGSLISYVLRITEVDPIKYGLLFERFLNPERKTMPDIDIDFSDTKRQKVIDYIKEKYGFERVSNIITYQTIMAKKALIDVGKVFGVNPSSISQLSKMIPNNYKINGSTSYTLNDVYKNIKDFREQIDMDKTDLKKCFILARKVEGLPRQKGMHAAGIVLNNTPLINSLPVTFENNISVTQYEKDFLEEQGYLKMDILGLTNLSTIEKCIQEIKIHRNIDIDISKIPYESPEIFKLINSKKVMGLFQLDTSAALHALEQIKPRSFEEVVATISLDRPGPQEYIPKYVKRKNGKENIEYYDKSLIPVLKDTCGIIIYQEQIMQICRIFAGFSYAKADIFRRAITKKNITQMEAMKDEFIAGATKKGHNFTVIDRLYNDILKFASYGFNKSHAVAYAMIACQMGYLKANYAPEFYCAILESQFTNSGGKFLNYANEILSSGIKILVPDVNNSMLDFSIYEGNLQMPLTAIFNFPRRVSENIIEERNRHGKFKSYEDFVVRMYATKDKISAISLEKLIDAGCFDTLFNNRKALKDSIENAISFASTSIYTENSLFDNFGLSLEIPDVKEDKIEKMKNEVESIGILLTESVDNFIDKNQIKNYNSISKLKLNEFSTIALIKTEVKKINVKSGKNKGKSMAFIKGFDSTSSIEVIVYSNTFDKDCQEIIDNNKILLINGSLNEYNDKISFIASKIEGVK